MNRVLESTDSLVLPLSLSLFHSLSLALPSLSLSVVLVVAASETYLAVFPKTDFPSNINDQQWHMFEQWKRTSLPSIVGGNIVGAEDREVCSLTAGVKL